MSLLLYCTDYHVSIDGMDDGMPCASDEVIPCAGDEVIHL